MKNTLILLVFAFSLLTTNQLMAQSTIEIQNAASEITKELKKEIKFNSDQEEKIYNIYVAYKKGMISIEKNNSTSSLNEEKKKLYSKIRESIQNVLTEEQYQLFKVIEKRNQN